MGSTQAASVESKSGGRPERAKHFHLHGCRSGDAVAGAHATLAVLTAWAGCSVFASDSHEGHAAVDRVLLGDRCVALRATGIRILQTIPVAATPSVPNYRSD